MGRQSAQQVVKGQAEAARRSWARRHPEKARDERAIRLQVRQDREAWRHKVHGTPETHAKASRVRQGAIARLHVSGAIDGDQLAAAVEIREVHARVTRDVTIGTASLETRVDRSGRHDSIFTERLGAVRAEVAYSRWRAQMRPDLCRLVLAIVVDDVGVAATAQHFGVRRQRALQILTSALDLWRELDDAACRDIDGATLAAAHAGIL